nr:hypothetical protein [Pandoravirus massiliensis]
MIFFPMGSTASLPLFRCMREKNIKKPPAPPPASNSSLFLNAHRKPTTTRAVGMAARQDSVRPSKKKAVACAANVHVAKPLCPLCHGSRAVALVHSLGKGPLCGRVRASPKSIRNFFLQKIGNAPHPCPH